MKKLLILFFLSLVQLSYGQQTVSLGPVEKIMSTELNESRTLNIYLPQGYHPDSAKTYPVIYLLDGAVNEDFIHIVGLVQFLTMIEKMPKSIVVGIANTDRKRDFTFPTTNEKDKGDFPTTGGSEKFISFLAKELQPFIQDKYKTNGIKTIIGQSLGGLLATEILFKQPKLFNQYVIVSPSLWWDDEKLLKLPRKEGLTEQVRAVYIGVGKEGKVMETDAKDLSTLVKEWGIVKEKLKFDYLPDEDHATILHNSAYRALIFINAKK